MLYLQVGPPPSSQEFKGGGIGSRFIQKLTRLRHRYHR
jgi:hypothetical protein